MMSDHLPVSLHTTAYEVLTRIMAKDSITWLRVANKLLIRSHDVIVSRAGVLSVIHEDSAEKTRVRASSLVLIGAKCRLTYSSPGTHEPS